MWTRRKSALKRATPPSAPPIIPFPTGRNFASRCYQALRTWLPSFSPFLLRRPELRRTSRDTNLLTAIHIFEATSLRVAGFEYSLPDVASWSLERQGEGGRTIESRLPDELLAFNKRFTPINLGRSLDVRHVAAACWLETAEFASFDTRQCELAMRGKLKLAPKFLP